MPLSNYSLEKYTPNTRETVTIMRSSGQNRTNWNLYYLIASIFILVVTLAGCSSESDTDAKPTESPGIHYALARYSQHVTEAGPVDYTDLGHWPPTSGHHWPRWAKCGFYENELPDELVVHNMEHGNIVISYNLVDQNEIDSLKKSFSDIPTSALWGVARFYSRIPEGQISLSTWGVTDSFTDIDTNRIRRFFEAYQGVLGPEKIPCDDHPE
ncbi:MAG: hypothetical protein Ct9H300mP11_21700 [Chloroflexota bacterium]|nr:MAG: hypothetical protein Ct9H300mP11_21700 [Chloroflexota bacterium]